MVEPFIERERREERGRKGREVRSNLSLFGLSFL
jgi:hypothetical protein